MVEKNAANNISTQEVGTDSLNKLIVLYRNPGQNSLAAPLGFECTATDSDHAEDQCQNANPGADVVWVFHDVQSGDDGLNRALDDYYSCGVTSTTERPRPE